MKKFMEMIGWVDRGINIDHEGEVLSKEVANIIAYANMHSYYPHNHTDSYYTSEEVNNSLWGATQTMALALVGA